MYVYIAKTRNGVFFFLYVSFRSTKIGNDDDGGRPTSFPAKRKCYKITIRAQQRRVRSRTTSEPGRALDDSLATRPESRVGRHRANNACVRARKYRTVSRVHGENTTRQYYIVLFARLDRRPPPRTCIMAGPRVTID